MTLRACLLDFTNVLAIYPVPNQLGVLSQTMSVVSYFRSEDYRKGDRLAALHDVYASVERVNIDVIGDDAPYFSVATRHLPDIALLDATISPMSPRRTREHASDGKDDLVFAFIESGKVSFAPHGGSEFELKGGEAYLGLNARASSHTLVGEPRFFDITIPRSVLDPRVQVHDYAATGKFAPSPALTLLKHYAQAVMLSEAVFDEVLARRASDHLLDLAALTLGARRDHAEHASENGLAFARLAAIKTDIRQHLVENWLTLDEMARRHGISPQYLRSLFYREGNSFTDFVRSERLDRAHAMLSDQEQAQLRISEIAYACGFGDLSHFNKCFRQRFAMPPSEARAIALDR